MKGVLRWAGTYLDRYWVEEGRGERTAWRPSTKNLKAVLDTYRSDSLVFTFDSPAQRLNRSACSLIMSPELMGRLACGSGITKAHIT